MPSEKLTHLLDELQRETGVTPTDTSALAAHEMPLTHRCAPKHMHALLETVTQSTELVASEGSANRAELGLTGNIFQWLGPCAYSETSLVLIWDPGQDATSPGVASPWDTGGLMTKGTVGRALSASEAIALLDAYTMPPPEVRDYLGAVMECCFAEPGDYIHGRLPARWYPGWLSGLSPQAVLPAAHTFEARRASPLPLFANLIAAVVQERAFAQAARLLRRFRSALTNADATYVPCREHENADEATRRFLWQHLDARGAL